MKRKPITDHRARPGPEYWSWRCLTCSEPVADHEGVLGYLWWQGFVGGLTALGEAFDEIARALEHPLGNPRARRARQSEARGGRCQTCGIPGYPGNRVKDYGHLPVCMTYEPGGTCTCARPGFFAHEYRCPLPVPGDVRPPAPLSYHEELKQAGDPYRDEKRAATMRSVADTVGVTDMQAAWLCGWCDGIDDACTMPGGCEEAAREWVASSSDPKRKPRAVWRRLRG